MRYLISDIHGCYDQYRQLLQKINFSSQDELYVLGDVVDRGSDPIKVLQDLMRRPNVIYILGNHDLEMYLLLNKLTAEITEKNCETQITSELLEAYSLWLSDGGAVTVKQFQKLSRDDQQEILDFIADASAYEEIAYKGRRYILTHAGLANFSSEKELEDYDLYDFVEGRADYGRRYFSDENVYLVTGHTPTPLIDGWNRAEVYKENGHIAIDCGCCMGGRLAAYCIETGETTYVRGIKNEETV